MKILSTVLGSVLLVGCASMGADRNSVADASPEYQEGPLWDDEEQDPGSVGDDDDAAAPPSIGWLSPAPGDLDHHYRAAIQVGFKQDSRGASVTLSRLDGVPVESTVEWSQDWSIAVLRPSRFLSPLTRYSVEVTLGDTILGYEFTTSAIGSAPEDPAALEGRTYALDLANASWGDLGQAIQANDATSSWLLQVHQTSEPTVESGTFFFELGFGSAGAMLDAQDTCAASGRLGDPLQDATRENAYFQSDVGDATVLVGDTEVLVESGRIDGDFLADGSGLSHVTYRGWIAETSLDEVVADSCAAAAELGAECEPCPSGRGRCHYLKVYELDAVHVPTLDVEQVDLASVLYDDECEGGSPVLACSAAAAPAAGWLLFLPLLLRRRR